MNAAFVSMRQYKSIFQKHKKILPTPNFCWVNGSVLFLLLYKALNIFCNLELIDFFIY